MLYGVDERQTKSDRPSKCDCASHSASSYLENRLTFENQTWYTIKRVSLVHFHTIITLDIISTWPKTKESSWRSTANIGKW